VRASEILEGPDGQCVIPVAAAEIPYREAEIWDPLVNPCESRAIVVTGATVLPARGMTCIAIGTTWVDVEVMSTGTVEEVVRRAGPAVREIRERGWAMSATTRGETIGDGSVEARVPRILSIRTSGHDVSNDGSFR